MSKTTKSQLVTAQIIAWSGAIVAAAIIFYLPHGPAPKHVFMLFPVLMLLGAISVATMLRVDFGDSGTDDSPADDG